MEKDQTQDSYTAITGASAGIGHEVCKSIR